MKKTKQKKAKTVKIKKARFTIPNREDYLTKKSHELHTHLNTIIGFSQLIKTGKVGSINTTQKEYLGDILISAKYLLQLINDVLARNIEKGRLKVIRSPTKKVSGQKTKRSR